MRTLTPRLLLAAVATLLLHGATAGAAPRSEAPASLALEEILDLRGGRARLSDRVRSLAGHRVQVRGWLVVFEEPTAGGFWLAPRPIFQDESGGGSGDLPPTAVRVRAPEPVLRALPQGTAPLEAVGRLEVGREDDAEGRVSLVRLVVEDPRDVRRLTPPTR